MGVFNYLSDFGEIDYSTFYNGPLTDYVESHQDDNNELFKRVIELSADFKVYTNFELNINYELLSNKKIGYRDAAKIPAGTIRVPYIIYWCNGNVQRAVLLNTNSYNEARGMYYCITEPENTLEPYRLEICANYLGDNKDDVYKCICDMYNNSNSVGYVQRRYDNMYLGDVEEMKETSVKLAEKIFEEATTVLPTIEDKNEKGKLINNVVGRVFLLKKSLYVRYMTNKTLLNDRHTGNVSEQRRFAKAYCDEIIVVPYYELWNGKKTIEEE